MDQPNNVPVKRCKTNFISLLNLKNEDENPEAVKRILIVDDEPYNILGLQLLFRQVGYNLLNLMVDRAYNGKEAMALISDSYHDGKHVYGLIFMDLSMPIMDGYEATKRIRSFYKRFNVCQPTIIACTGHIEEEYIKKAWKHDINEVVPKPLHEPLLKSILKDVVEFS